MPDQGQYRQQPNQQADTRSRAAEPPPRYAPPANSPPPAYEPVVVPAVQDSKQKTSFKADEEKRTAGKAGERNLTLQWIPTPLGNADSARFNAQTSQGNGLEVTIEQTAYNRTYTGTGTVTTGVVPVAPIGTRGRVTVTDTTSGETLVQTFTWRDVGQGSGGGLWQMIKNLFWKG